MTNWQTRSRRVLAAGGLSLMAAGGFAPGVPNSPANAATHAVQAVPFVACPGDGQVGPISPLETKGAAPLVAASFAPRLAYYAFRGLGVLAPRGWHCFALYGSDGDQLFVTPEVHGYDDLIHAHLSGPAVVVACFSGETSGRFEVAEIAARLFPSARAFVQGVIAEAIEPASRFHFAPYPHDRVHHLSRTMAEFVTPPSRTGLGTSGRLTPADEPVAGVAIWLPDEANDLVMVSVRLPRTDRSLSREGRTQGENYGLARRHQRRPHRPHLDLHNRRSCVIGVGLQKRCTRWRSASRRTG